MGRGRHPHKRITGSHAARERSAIDIGFKPIAKEPGVALVDLFKAGNGRTGIDECLGRERRWSFDEHCGTPVASCQTGCRAETHAGSANITTIVSRSRDVWPSAQSTIGRGVLDAPSVHDASATPAMVLWRW